MKAVFDSNILIDSLNGVGAAIKEIERYAEGSISFITWIEVMAGAKSESDALIIRRFLRTFEQIALDADIAEQAVTLRRDTKLKLPDAIILATARVNDAILITRDTAFPDMTGIRIPYKI